MEGNVSVVSVAVCCSVLQCVAVCCSVLQRGEVCCSVFKCVGNVSVVCISTHILKYIPIEIYMNIPTNTSNSYKIVEEFVSLF